MFAQGYCRNPFYSGRFFHSGRDQGRPRNPGGGVAIPSIQVGFFTPKEGVRRPVTAGRRSQSLLFRSVFSLAEVAEPQAGRDQGVAIPSIQVGFFTRKYPPASPASGRSVSQSLLFRSVFSLSGHPKRPRPPQRWVAIPSIQVGFFTRQ